MQTIDWLIIVLYFVLISAIAVYMARRAGKNTGEFFLSGRKLPWYIAGTSMVATTFAADTPLAVTELVANNGIAGNWLWWNMFIGGALTVFFFARLWRRAGILTDCEFVAIRYSGKEANFLRGFRAIYIGIFMNIVVIAWVNLAMVKIFTVIFPNLTFFGSTQLSIPGFTFDAHLLLVGCVMLFVAIYSALSGLWGITFSDVLQFTVKMTGCIILAVFALRQDQIGGIAGLREKLPEWVFNYMPSIGGTSEAASVTGLLRLSVITFITYIGVQWWASWYPGAEPGGGGYVAQRMMSAKNEKHALGATLWFQIAHFALRPWPWILVALCTLVMYPDLPPGQKGDGFIMIIRDTLPAGLLGLLLAAFFAAYMSTIASQTVWGTSYIVNDLYRPFLKKGAQETYYVKVSRITTFILMFISLLVTSKMERISDAWKFVLEASGGIGLVLILRWFWWRINAWSEISAIVAPFVIYPILKFVFKLEFPHTLLIIVGWSTIVWLTATFLTKPTEENTLVSFYRKVHPGGAGWKKISSILPDVKSDKGYGYLMFNWFAGSIMVISSLFAIGKLIFGEFLQAAIYLFIVAVCGLLIFRNMNKVGWGEAI